MTKKENNNELELLAQEIFVLQQKGNRTHEDDNKLHNRLFTLRNKIFHVIYGNDVGTEFDFELFDKAFQEIISKFSPANENNLATLVNNRYQLKCKGKKAEKLKEQNPVEAGSREREIRKALREIALENGMPSKDITTELKKFNLLNRNRVHGFLTSNFHFSDEELEKFDETIFDKSHTVQFDASNEESDNTQNIAVIETATTDKRIEALEIIPWFDRVLDITYDASVEQGKKRVKYMRGYWSIHFIEGDISERRAKEKEKHIIFKFFLQNKHLYDYFEDHIVLSNKEASEGLTEKQVEILYVKLHKKAIDELHKELMPKMSNELSLKPDTWYGHYRDIDNYVWRVINQLHFMRMPA